MAPVLGPSNCEVRSIFNVAPMNGIPVRFRQLVASSVVSSLVMAPWYLRMHHCSAAIWPSATAWTVAVPSTQLAALVCTFCRRRAAIGCTPSSAASTACRATTGATPAACLRLSHLCLSSHCPWRRWRRWMWNKSPHTRPRQRVCRLDGVLEARIEVWLGSFLLWQAPWHPSPLASVQKHGLTLDGSSEHQLE